MISLNRVTVLMSTYNGERYLERQIDSILGQEEVEVHLVVRDDGSCDKTVSILNNYSKKYGNKISYCVGKENLGACKSFFELMTKEYDTEYFALSDQDDIWDKDKLKIAIQKLKTLPKDKPALYYSNLRIVDQNENYIRESHSKPMVAGGKYSFLADVFVTGCTAVFNKQLQSIAVKIKPQNFSMHDTWLYVVASMFGNCVYDFNSHISYRQHGDNVVGTRKRKLSFESLKREFRNYFNWKSQPRLLCAQEILKQFSTRIDAETLGKLMKFVNYKDSILSTIKLAFDRDFNSDNTYRTLRFKITVLLHNA